MQLLQVKRSFHPCSVFSEEHLRCTYPPRWHQRLTLLPIRLLQTLQISGPGLRSSRTRTNRIAMSMSASLLGTRIAVIDCSRAEKPDDLGWMVYSLDVQSVSAVKRQPCTETQCFVFMGVRLRVSKLTISCVLGFVLTIDNLFQLRVYFVRGFFLSVEGRL